MTLGNWNDLNYMAAFCKYARNRAGEIWFTVPSEIQFKKVTQYRLAEIGGQVAKLGEGSQRVAVTL